MRERYGEKGTKYKILKKNHERTNVEMLSSTKRSIRLYTITRLDSNRLYFTSSRVGIPHSTCGKQSIQAGKQAKFRDSDSVQFNSNNEKKNFFFLLLFDCLYKHQRMYLRDYARIKYKYKSNNNNKNEQKKIM